MRPLDKRARAEGRGQRFLVTRSQLLGMGGDDDAIRTRVHSGNWRAVQAGVYQIDSRPRVWEDKLVAAALAAGEEAVVSHRAALVVWGLDGITTAPVEITVPHTHGPVPDGTVVHRTRRPVESTTLRSIKVTTVERTLLDCAALLPPIIVTKAVESALRMRLTTLKRLYAFLKKRGGRGVKGTRLLRIILNGHGDDTATGSGAETEALYHMRQHGIPEPVLQHCFVARDGDPIHPDFYWPQMNKAIEIDGIDAHDSADKLDHDLHRQNKLMDLGVDLRRFSARYVRRHPLRFVQEVQRFLDS